MFKSIPITINCEGSSEDYKLELDEAYKYVLELEESINRLYKSINKKL